MSNNKLEHEVQKEDYNDLLLKALLQKDQA